MQADTVSTSDLPVSQQFDAWMDWFDGIFDVAPHHPPRNGFQAQSQSWQIGACILSRVRAPAIRVERSVTHVRRNQLDHWIITLSRHETSLVSSGDKTLRVPPGSPFVLSLADALTSERAEDRRLQLYMSRDKFTDLAPALDRARGTVLGTTLGSLLSDYLGLLEHILPDISPGELDRLSDSIGAMVAACLGLGRNRADAADLQIDAVLLERIHHAVRKYLRSPALGPRLLCQRLSISRSKLYRLMDAEGGVARYIQRQRLLEAYALLANPSVDRPVTAIGEELCFADTSGFSRAFRREFSTSPSEIRAASRTGQKPRKPSTHANTAAARSLHSLLRAV
jgi:AraC-like DNA-binding protein